MEQLPLQKASEAEYALVANTALLRLPIVTYYNSLILNKPTLPNFDYSDLGSHHW